MLRTASLLFISIIVEELPSAVITFVVLIIIDDNPSVYLNMKDNIIPIKFCTGEQNDDSLLKIKNLINNYYNSGGENLKEFIKRNFCYEV